jgi:hypothetical protein
MSAVDLHARGCLQKLLAELAQTSEVKVSRSESEERGRRLMGVQSPAAGVRPY